MRKIKILAISPYPGMVPLLNSVAAEYENIELAISIGDLSEGLALAQKGFHANFDIILSRGGTAKLLKQAVSLPVIEIDTTVQDVFDTIKRAHSAEGKMAIVGYSNITQDLSFLHELLPYKIDIHTIQSSAQAVTTLQYLRKEQHTTILCDTVTYTLAKEMDFNAFLITSGSASIRSAFEQALFFCGTSRQLKTENKFLRQLLNEHSSHTVVFTLDGKLVLSSLENTSKELLEMLSEKINTVAEQGQTKVLQQFQGALYNISAVRISSGDENFVAFSFLITTPPIIGDRYGISYLNFEGVRQMCEDSIYNIVGLTTQYHQSIAQAARLSAPVFILGAVGAGKEYIARTVYMRSSENSNPFIQIDCNLLSQKTWNYLLRHYTSPLCGTNNTIYFQNLNALDEVQWRQLLAFLLEGGIAKNNRLIFSNLEASSEYTSKTAMEYINRLSCFPLALSSLQENPRALKTAISLFLDRNTITTGKQWKGIDTDAMNLFCQYPWPQNYLQFMRVMEHIVEFSLENNINIENTRAALQAEMALLTVSDNTNAATYNSLNLSQPLSEINYNIAKIVLEKNGDNQSKAAQSLGISRTTLWRMLKK